MTDTAIVLVDIQNDYFPGGLWPLPGMNAAAANAGRLLNAARHDPSTLIVHIRHQAASEAAPFFRPGTDGAEIHASVAPLADEIVLVKGRPNSFIGTGLEALLKEQGVSAVTICGAMSQMCIDATARAAVDLGFKTTVVEDACAARDVMFGGLRVPAEAVHAAIMAPLAMSYGTVVSTDTVLGQAAA